jgi:hypothetical protein
MLTHEVTAPVAEVSGAWSKLLFNGLEGRTSRGKFHEYRLYQMEFVGS